jgi:single-stranded DNA-binding protein
LELISASSPRPKQQSNNRAEQDWINCRILTLDIRPVKHFLAALPVLNISPRL